MNEQVNVAPNTQGTVDIANKPVEQGNVNPGVETKTTETQTTEQANNVPITEEALKEIKAMYQKQFDDIKKDSIGKDKKITELQNILKKKNEETLTEEQKREIETQKIREQYHNLYIKETIAEYNLKKDDPDMDFTGFFYSSETEPEKMNEEIKEKGRMLKEHIDKVVKAGIERGINERLATGAYVPRSSISSNPNDLKNMTKEQLATKVNEVTKMPASKEKTQFLNELMAEQLRRMKGE